MYILPFLSVFCTAVHECRIVTSYHACYCRFVYVYKAQMYEILCLHTCTLYNVRMYDYDICSTKYVQNVCQVRTLSHDTLYGKGSTSILFRHFMYIIIHVHVYMYIIRTYMLCQIQWVLDGYWV